MKNRVLFSLAILLLLIGCKEKAEVQPQFSSRQISEVIARMTDIMVHDVTNPPLAGRFFSYACLAGYEVVAQNDTAYSSMHGVLNGYPQIEKPDTISGYSYELSAILAMLETAKKMQPSGTMLEEYQQQLLDSLKAGGVSEALLTNSLNYAVVVSKQILAYAKADKYNQISNYPRYTPLEEEGSWYPTPPGFFAPVEPYFNTIRAFTLDDNAQFKPAPPAAFSTNKDSDFYRLLMETYEKGGTKLSEEERLIASFWDCNPFALQDNGHLMVGAKKISPGAHWLGITGIACEKAGVDFSKAMKINTVVSVSLMDGFVACWDEKFRSHRIRPETAIRKHIDPNWQPLLQTPPFPEYLSGHSTISSAAAVVLTHYLGDNFEYVDTVEVRFGLPSRKFTSFQQAAIEAGISRLYGGIHYMDAIDNGRTQGLQVGEWVLRRVEKSAAASGVVADNH
ncbi:vanadium-dependent haloperoxidase [Cesiribacter sp. SM1]|uniref:vanadium-dependent haloperoxidase n=1 Tax=Cesiribacter sp. SM1 TaxID=2861196 RepID=UPI001CD542A3|nr:vanadium-dependent haloperoxidase [Cesiribacter sp. SM1]